MDTRQRWPWQLSLILMNWHTHWRRTDCITEVKRTRSCILQVGRLVNRMLYIMANGLIISANTSSTTQTTANSITLTQTWYKALQSSLPPNRLGANNFTAAKLDNGFKFNMFIFWNLWSLSRCAFGALTLLTGHWKEHPVCKNWLMRCWCGYLSGARCRLYAYGPADATASQNPIITHLIWIQAGFTLLVPAYPGFLGKEAVKRGE